VVSDHGNNILGRLISRSAKGDDCLHLDEFGDVRTSEDWGANGVREKHLHTVLRDGEDQELDEWLLIGRMIGRGIG
jgi:hypothetical protein